MEANQYHHNNFAQESIGKLRHRLLDLTARNRLLNFTHGRQGCIRIIDELPDEIHRLLLSEEELRFKAIPDPTRKELIDAGYIENDPQTGLDRHVKKDPTTIEWGTMLGFNTSYDLLERITADYIPSKHTDKAIQTLMFPSEMEARLRGLRAKAETAIEETGSNICYVAFGFLEWFESPDSDKPRHAPLILVPVRIAKGKLNSATGTYNYTLTYTGEDILPNLSLREKLRIDFGLALTELSDRTPDDYFKTLQNLANRHQPRWRVRRWATVSLFNFSKLLMYLDLDPKQWPIDKQITNHPIVSRFFTTKVEERTGNSVADEYQIDDITQVHEQYPLVDDADSSQHSALIDAVSGKNLVIVGPPGTGKSQTITNLIAACLAQGKRVLFVAEKLAALEVVKRRLDLAGLGDFCLELHSHKTQKRKVLDDITIRLNNQTNYRKPEQIDVDISRYEVLKDELRRYAELINRKWKQTELTIHQILMAASRYREALGIDPCHLHPKGYDGDLLTPTIQRQTLDTVRLFAEVYGLIAQQLGTVDDIGSHPWYGVCNRDLQLFDKDRVCASLQLWQEALDALSATLGAVESGLSNEIMAELGDLNNIESMVGDLAAIPVLRGNEVLSALARLHGNNLTTNENHLILYREICKQRLVLAQSLATDHLDNLESHEQLRAACDELKQLGVAEATTLTTLAALVKPLEQLQARVQLLEKPMAAAANALGPPFTNTIKLTPTGLAEFRAVVELVSGIKLSLLKLRGEWLDDDALDDILPALKTQVDALRATRVELGEYFTLDRLPPLQELELMQVQLTRRGLFRWMDGKWRASRRTLMSLAAKPEASIKDLTSRLARLLGYARDKEALDAETRYKVAFGIHFQGIETAVTDLFELRQWYKSVRQRYGIGFGPRVAFGDALLAMQHNVARGIQSLEQQQILVVIEEILGHLGKFKSVFGGYAPLQSIAAPLVGDDAVLLKLHNTLTRVLPICQGQLINPEASVADVVSVCSQLQELQSLRETWGKTGVQGHWFGGYINLLADPEHLNAKTVAAAENTLALARAVEDGINNDLLRNAIRSNPTPQMFTALRELSDQLTRDWGELLKRRDQFSALTELDLDAWQERTKGKLDGLRARNLAALQAPNWLSNWLDYVRLRYQVESLGFAFLAKTLEQGGIELKDIDAGYKLAVNDLLARQIFKEIPGLARFSGNTHLAVQKQFREYDDKLKRLQRERIAWQIAQNPVSKGYVGARAADYTDLALLQRECEKKKKHIPLRQLVRRAGNALAAIKPCFMMGPMSVAQYLAPGEINFDLIVMDEASQMKPEDALGAIARGNQFVVVGDPNQLPPTSFFDRMLDDDEEESTAIQESESILDTAGSIFDTRTLRWHYRSQHEHLIAFSNQKFYDNQLVVFPTSHSVSEEFGVKFVRVPRGRFINRRNIEEARVIALAVQAHFLHRPQESLGVVAMSADQRDQIERAVEAVAKEDPLFQAALEQNQLAEEPFFIKNLENVQGDERNVIFISCTYGPEEIAGKVFQRFGPINSDMGWRRLNVLFTRSKKRMHVFSSLGSEDILVSGTSKRGVIAFRDFLAFAETGHLHRTIATGRAPDSDFEVAVGSALDRAGFRVEPQVGVAGFFIDLAVRDPGNPGRYLMGIECDGASYHSAKSVRDRDRLRQAVLERLGWRIRRIWSTDWYRNPKGEIEPIIRELNSLKTKVRKEAPQPDETAEVHDIVEREGQQDQLLDATLPRGFSLREKLLRFDREIIRSQCPKTPENQRLLRPAMLEALLEFVPVTRTEFLESLPLYLRQATCSEESKRYLDQVLRIIEETETEKFSVT